MHYCWGRYAWFADCIFLFKNDEDWVEKNYEYIVWWRYNFTLQRKKPMLWSWHKTSHSVWVLCCHSLSHCLPHVHPSLVRLLHSSLIGLYAYIKLVTYSGSKICQINQCAVYLSRGRVIVVCTWAILGESGDRDRASSPDVTAAPSTKPDRCTSQPDRPPVKPSVSPIALCLHLNSLLIAGTRSDEVTKRKTFNLTLKGG